MKRLVEEKERERGGRERFSVCGVRVCVSTCVRV